MDELDSTGRLHVDALDAEYTRRHGVAVDYLKAEVGDGDLYENPVARVVISPNGAWFECTDLPMEFSGSAGAPVDHRFVTDAEAIKMVDNLYEFTKSAASGGAREFGLFVLYTKSGIVDGRNVYAFQYSQKKEGAFGAKPQEIGKFQPGVLPLFYRCRIDADSEAAGLPFKRGVVFCLAHAGEMNLVVEMPYEGEELRDLSDTPVDPIPQ
jgi:hypothetical protein